MHYEIEANDYTMNLDELKIEKQEVMISQNEYNRRQIRLEAALLEIASFLDQKEAALLGATTHDREEVAFKEAA